MRAPVLALVAAVALAACGQGTEGGGAAASPADPAARPNLVLLTLDTTRADHLGAWGWPHARTPSLDALAGRGTRFARCDTAVPVTLPSHATLLTGLLPPRHGVRDNATFTLPSAFETVAEALAARGYATAAVVSAAVLARRYGLDQGFSSYDDDLGAEGDAAATERQAGATTRVALERLAGLEAPFFLWVHYFDPHDDYAPPEPFAGQAAGPHPLYDGEIAYMDAEIGRLLAAMPGGTVVVAVGDHGEMLGEHGEPTHGLLLYAGARRVPLMLAGPGVPQGRTVDCLVRTADVAPTLLALAGAPIGAADVPAGLDGESLLPLLGGEAGCDRESYGESFLPLFAYGWFPLRSLSDSRWLYLYGARPGLYDLDEDPGEATDLAPRRPDAVAEWQERLTARVAAMGEELEARVEPQRTLSAEERARLAALGYVSGGGAPVEVSRDLPDPRDMTGVAQAIDRASGLVESGRFSEALPELRQVLERDPGNFPALNLAGLALMATGRPEAALGLFRRAAEENPDSAVPRLNAGHCLLQLGRGREAEEAYAGALARDPSSPGAASNLARLLRERGEAAEAEGVLAAAFAAGSRHPGLYLERGMLAAARGDLAAALEAFRQAADRDAGNPVPLDNAARAAMLLERWGEAAELYERLVALTPDRAATWGILGSLYLDRLGDPAAARRCFERAHALETDPARRERLAEALARLGSP